MQYKLEQIWRSGDFSKRTQWIFGLTNYSYVDTQVWFLKAQILFYEKSKNDS